MCLSVPGQVLSIDGDHATVDVQGNSVECNMMVLADVGVGVGDYVLVHAGFAIQKYDPDEAHAILDMLREALR